MCAIMDCFTLNQALENKEKMEMDDDEKTGNNFAKM